LTEFAKEFHQVNQIQMEEINRMKE